jgi:hypothetical protein
MTWFNIIIGAAGCFVYIILRMIFNKHSLLIKIIAKQPFTLSIDRLMAGSNIPAIHRRFPF